MLKKSPVFLLVFLLSSALPAQDSSLKEGVQLANEGQRGRGIEKLRQLASRESGNASAQLALGLVSLESRNYFEAEKALAAAAALDANSVAAHFGLGMMYEKQKRADEARAEWQKVLALTREEDVKAIAQRHLDRLSQ
jgi:Tfp pilus assembly protein PilF